MDSCLITMYRGPKDYIDSCLITMNRGLSGCMDSCLITMNRGLNGWTHVPEDVVLGQHGHHTAQAQF